MEHLTWDHISAYLVSAAEPRWPDACSRHSRECDTCRFKAARIELALSDFRTAARQWIVRPRHAEEERLLEFNGSIGLYAGNEARAGFGSLAVHALAIALLLFLGSLKPAPKQGKAVVRLLAPPRPLKAVVSKSGGGGGARQPMVQKADLPRLQPRQFIPPRVDTVQSKLELPSSILDAPDIAATAVGDLAGLSAMNGPGYDGGIGKGLKGGIGDDVGPGADQQPDAGSIDAVYRSGNGITNPIPIYQPEPQYSEEARKAKWQGSVLISLVVDEAGKPMGISVVRPLGLGLDEKAVEAVRQWKFKPGTRNGKPVKVQAQIEVTFRLL